MKLIKELNEIYYIGNRGKLWKTLREIASDIVCKFDFIEEIRVFGSLAKSKFGFGSDIDILIITNKRVFKNPSDAYILLCDYFYDKVPYIDFDIIGIFKKDIEYLKKSSPFFKDIIENSKIIARKTRYSNTK